MNKILNKVSNYIMSYSNIDDIKYYQTQEPINKNHLEKIGFNYLNVIPKPPLNNSIEVLSELDELIEITTFRNSSDTYLVYMVDREPLELFANFALKNDIKLPLLKFKQLYYDYVSNIITDIKNYYNRPRPKQLADFLEKDLSIIYTESHETPAYPSGHAAYAYLAAHVFSDMYNKYKREFFEIADQCAYARMLQGVHYRSDNVAAKILINRIYNQIKTLDNQRKFKNVKISKIIE